MEKKLFSWEEIRRDKQKRRKKKYKVKSAESLLSQIEDGEKMNKTKIFIIKLLIYL